MSREGLKTRRRRKKVSQLARILRREGKKYCALALCTSLIAGRIGSMVASADSGAEKAYEFELSRETLYEALQDAVAEDHTVNKEFTFEGEEAESYASLLEAGADLYELTPEIKENGGAVNLRIFARLDGEIALDSAYEVNGSEEMIFLLTNTSDKEKNAIIYVDDKVTEQITVAPKNAVAAETDGNSALAADELFGGPGAAGDAAADAGQGAVIGGGTAGGSGLSGSGSGGGSHSGSSANASGAAEMTEEEKESISESEPEKAAEEIQDAEKETENDSSQSTVENDFAQEAGKDNAAAEKPNDSADIIIDVDNNGVNKDSEITEDSNVKIEEPEQADDQTAENEAGENDGADDAKNDAGDTADKTNGTEDKTNGTEDQASSIGENKGSGSDDKNSSKDSKDNKDSKDSVKDSEDSAKDSTKDSGKEDSKEDGKEKLVAAISRHKTYVVTATPSDAEADEATPSDATDSNADKSVIDGTLYQAVRFNNAAAVAFVTTAEDVGITSETMTDILVEALFNRLMSCETYEELSNMMEAMTEEEYVLLGMFSDEQNAMLTAKIQKLQAYVPMLLDVNSVEIKDTVATDGCLTVWVNGVENPAGMEYEWYEKVGNEYQLIETTQTLDASSYKFDYARYGFNEDGSSKEFKVVVKQVTDGNVISQQEKIVELATEYYNSLQNGGFEKPQNTYTNAGPQYKESDVPAWKTTGKGTGDKTGHDIEILSVGHSDSIQNFNLTQDAGRYNDYETSWKEGNYNYTVTGVPEGKQCAELNCEAWGALYQDVVTVPGSTLYWSFYHRGRFGTDTMQLIIQDSDGTMVTAGTQYTAAQGAQTDENGNNVFSADVKNGWQYHSGSYVVPEGQYVTRFYFVSVSCTNDNGNGGQSTGTNATVGNYLDDVTFSKKVPEPAPSRGNLTIGKTVAGIEDAASHVQKETFTFEVKDENGSVIREVKLPTANGEWNVTLVNVREGTYTVKETGIGTVDKYNFVSTSVDSMDITANKTVDAAVTAGEEKKVEFVNTYEPANTSITLKKLVTGNMGDRKKSFSFEVKVDGTVKGTYQLQHGSEQVISEIPIGAVVEVTESNNEGYEIDSVTVDGQAGNLSNSTLTFTVSGEKDNVVVFTNKKEADIDAGILLDSMPYALLLGAAAAGIAFYFIRKRKEEGLD